MTGAIIGRVCAFDALPQPLVVMILDPFSPQIVAALAEDLRYHRAGDTVHESAWQRWTESATRVQLGRFLDRWLR